MNETAKNVIACARRQLDYLDKWIANENRGRYTNAEANAIEILKQCFEALEGDRGALAALRVIGAIPPGDDARLDPLPWREVVEGSER